VEIRDWIGEKTEKSKKQGTTDFTDFVGAHSGAPGRSPDESGVSFVSLTNKGIADIIRTQHVLSLASELIICLSFFAGVSGGFK
jgi:hypothetical protein